MNHSFIKDTMYIFAIDILVLTLMVFLFGESAKGVSTMFRLGSEGLALETIMQYFFSAAVIAGWKSLFFSGKIFKNMMILWRTIGMLFAIMVSMVCFIAVCGWFPISNVEGWIGFIVSFVICVCVSVGCMILKTHIQSCKYEKLLKKYQRREGAEHDQAERQCDPIGTNS